MNMTIDQVVAAHKTNMDTLFGLTGKAFEGAERLIELNVSASKAALGEAQAHAAAMLTVKDAQELLALQASMLQPMAEKAASYGRHVYDITSSTAGEFGKVYEAKVAETQKTVIAVVDNMAKNAPAGSETAVAVMKSAVAATNNAVEAVQKAVKQATDVAEANFNAVAAQAVQASKAASTTTSSRKR